LLEAKKCKLAPFKLAHPVHHFAFDIVLYLALSGLYKYQQLVIFYKRILKFRN